MKTVVRSTLTRSALVAATAVCLLTWLVGAKTPFFDYDDATQGIFINDVSFQGDLDASFEGRPDRQDRYRTTFAAQRLPFTLPLSWVQRGLALPPWEVESILRAAALAFALAGSWLAALVLLPQPGGSRGECWVLVAALAVHPSLALFTRTGASFYVFAYALFWLGTWAAFRWLTSGRPLWIYVASVTAGACLLSPYPPLLCWPLAATILAVWEGRLRGALRSPHLYRAAAIALAGTVVTIAGMARAYDTSIAAFLSRQATFRAYRGDAVALAQLVSVSPVDKIVKLVDQHLLSRTDRLGDLSRDDSPWVLGAVQPAVILWALAAGYGFWVALRQRAAEDRRALAVAAAVLLVFFSVSFPEGRYILVLLPCWGYFALRGAGAVLRGDTHRVALAVGLSLLAAGTEYGFLYTYVPKSRQAWVDFEGMRAAAPVVAALPDGGRGIDMIMPYPPQFMPELRFRMLMPPGATWLPRNRAEEMLVQRESGRRMAALVYADELAWVDYLLTCGFSRRAELIGEASGRTLLVLVRPPSPWRGRPHARVWRSPSTRAPASAPRCPDWAPPHERAVCS